MDHAQSKLDIVLVGQLGNWLFLTASAALEFGRDRLGTARNIVNTQEEFDRASRLFRILCPWLPLSRETAPQGVRCSYRQRKSNWQSLAAIPPREACRELFRLPEADPVDEPVIHARGGDYLTFFGPGARAAQTAGSIRMCAEALGADTAECTVVTDDPEYVRSMGLPLGRIVSGDIVEDFMLMANARRLAVSPSTFSWWAGFLGRHDTVVFPQGFGPWDTGALDSDPFSAHSNADLCWGDECRMAGDPSDGIGGTACAVVCTGRYRELYPGFLESFRRHVKGDRTLYVFTDDPSGLPAGPDVRFVRVMHGRWPYVVLHKHGMLHRHGGMLSRHRRIVVMQANMRFTADMDFSGLEGLHLCFHPYGGEGRDYVCGGLFGGTAGDVLRMAEWVDGYIGSELAAGRVPRWHDETAVNEYRRRFPGRVAGTWPSWTMYAEERPDLRREGSSILLLDKNRFFGCGKREYAV